MVKKNLKTSIQKALKQLGFDRRVDIELEHPTEEKFGDWSTNIALKFHKEIENVFGPRDLAEKIVEILVLDKSLIENSNIEKITIAGPGFINFKLSENYFKNFLKKNLSIEDIGKNLKLQKNNKEVIVEYSSPNIAKPFTIGHLRSTIIGDAIANLYEALGWKTYRDNHLGDWGTQFGKLIYAIKTWGDVETINNSEKPVAELVKLYVKFHDEIEKNPTILDEGRTWFKKLEDGDDEARELWQWSIELSWKEFDKIYNQLQVNLEDKKFENHGRGYGESFFEDKMDEVLKILEKQLPESKKEKNSGFYGEGKNGAKMVFFEDEKLPPMMILKGDGATLYSTRDLATDYFRLKNYSKVKLIINEVGAEQSLYFKQLYKIEEMLGWYKGGERVHVRHGLYRFKDKKMSTRKGNVIWLEEVINEAITRAKKIAGNNDTNHNTVAIGALKWNDLKSETNRDIIFNWDEILNMKGNSGPYVQYAGVRAKSVLKKANNPKSKKITTEIQNFKFNESELALSRQLTKFKENVKKSAHEFAPHFLAGYLFELAQRFNSFYNSQQILKLEDKTVTNQRLLLTQITLNTLTIGLSLLGIQIPEEM